MSQTQRFGHVEIRPTERVLVVDGRRVAPGGRAFDLLLALIENRDRLVTKDELLATVWRGRVVEENNLQTQVSTLRKLLGRQAIATVAGRGYRFTLAPAPADGPPCAPDNALPSPDRSELAWSAASQAALPTGRSALIGRDGDLSELEALLAQHRLVTVIGAGGIGKTALALLAAHRALKDGPVAWVDLAPAADAPAALAAISHALGLSIDPVNDPLPILVDCLCGRRLLVVLDGAEHLVDVVLRVAQALVVDTAEVRLLVTSQVGLHLEGERVFRLGGLAVPAAGTGVDAAMAHGAVALFVDQAQADDRHFRLHEANVGTVIELCRRLDGVALAIKLAASRTRLLGLEGVASRLGERLQLLNGGTRDAPSRHQTLRAAFDWSHSLLSPGEQTVFRRLGVFARHFSLELAQAVAGDSVVDEWALLDALGVLVERSMVAIEAAPGAAQRYRLPEIALEYAGVKLREAGELDTLQRRHAQAVAALMDRAYEAYWCTADSAWLARFGHDIDNLRRALDWAMQHDTGLAVQLSGRSSFVFLLLGLAAEGRCRWLALQPAVGADIDADSAARFWLEGSRLHWGIARGQMADFAERAMAMYRQAGDCRGQYLALRLLAASSTAGDAAVQQLIDEMLTLELPAWPARLHAQRLLAQVSVLRQQARLAEARGVIETLLLIADEAGLDAEASFAESSLADVDLVLGDLGAAESRCRRLLGAARPLSGNYRLQVLATLAASLLLSPAAMPAALADARHALIEFLQLSRSHGWEWLGLHANLLALLAACEGRLADAAGLIGYADLQQQRVGTPAWVADRARARAWADVMAAMEPARVDALLAAGSHYREEDVYRLTVHSTTRHDAAAG